MCGKTRGYVDSGDKDKDSPRSLACFTLILCRVNRARSRGENGKGHASVMACVPFWQSLLAQGWCDMSWTIVNRIWLQAQVEGTELLLLLAIAHHVNKSGVAYPSVRRLARFVKKGTRTVQTLIRKLEREGHITVAYRMGPRGTNVYRICPFVPDAIASAPEVQFEGRLSGAIATAPELVDTELSKMQAGLAMWSEGFIERVMGED